MFRLVDRPLGFRQRANEWIYKMLFLWSREPVPGPRAGPWFAWFATAVLLWRCRRRLAKAILAISPFRIFRKAVAPISIPNSKLARERSSPMMELHPKHSTGIKTRVKRLYTGDGLHVSSSSMQVSQQVNYRVTRSGRIYGKYPNKTVVTKRH
ncbi:uncharacterized protein LOC107266188 isoform X2 [Cephus cinctus]|uniref:Uncharacterized protein LOC107266188 isoform X2 n=1 Tax=Cephus cinctus TaxID=211228 RepID=A0AAJ7REN0_CEPCN|nr:uncharacterized protein LOC107266188 isoform X2 [Cephus cinctus]XP_024939224.1 uncharacterized protein LOC107266188 isoform X2 [Cephus cinctus]